MKNNFMCLRQRSTHVHIVLFLYHSCAQYSCVSFKSEVVARGVIYATARRLGVPLTEDPPWTTLFDADVAGIQKVRRTPLASMASPRRGTCQFINVQRYELFFLFVVLDATLDV